MNKVDYFNSNIVSCLWLHVWKIKTNNLLKESNKYDSFSNENSSINESYRLFITFVELMDCIYCVPASHL